MKIALYIAAGISAVLFIAFLYFRFKPATTAADQPAAPIAAVPVHVAPPKQNIAALDAMYKATHPTI